MKKHDPKIFHSISLAGNYNAAPETCWQDLLDDAGCMLDCVVAQLQSMVRRIDDDSENARRMTASEVFGTMCLAEIARGLAAEAHRRVFAEMKETSEPEN